MDFQSRHHAGLQDTVVRHCTLVARKRDDFQKGNLMMLNNLLKQLTRRPALIAILIGIVLLFLITHPLFTDKNRASMGRIAFLWSPDGSSTMNLILSDGNGNSPRFMGYFSGTLAFSPDGGLLAIGCRRSEQGIVSEICILDVNKFSSAREQIVVGGYDTRFPITSKIALPNQCLEYQYKKGESFEGIFSIDWSPKADRLILVCGKPSVREVCIVPLEGNANCWDKNVSTDVFRATWSPVDENAILVADWQYPTSKIYLVDPSGKRIKYITDGGSPTWSPDGKQIAYVESIYYPDTGNRSQGIASINIDGSNHKWLYKPNLAGIEDSIDLLGISSGRPTRLAWSPDGRFIVFSGVNGYWFNFRIFRLDISTGEIIILMDPGVFSKTVTEPDWGP